MSFKKLNLIWDIRSKLISPTEKSILLRLAGFGENIYPGKGRIAKDTGFNKDTVKSAIKSLEAKGFISQKRRKKKEENVNDTNLYKINYDVLLLLPTRKEDSKKAKPITNPEQKGGGLHHPGGGLHHPGGGCPDHPNKKGLFPTQQVVVEEVVEMKRKGYLLLVANGITEQVAVGLEKVYTDQQIINAINLSNQPGVRHKQSYLISALKDNYQTNDSIEALGGYAAHYDAKPIINERDELHKKITEKKIKGDTKAHDEFMKNFRKSGTIG